MPVGAQGSAFKLYMKAETTEGTAATGNYDQAPCFDLSLGSTQEFGNDQLLSVAGNRDAGDPFYGRLSVAGSVRVPIDTVHFGRWLEGLFGTVSPTGTNPNFTRVYKSGGTALRPYTIEKAFPDITRFESMVGVLVGSMDLNITDTGPADATFGLLARNEVAAGSSIAGTPVITSFARFQRPTGAIARGGTALAAVVGGNIRFSNALAPVNTVRSDLQIEGVDLGQTDVSGNISIRFQNHALLSDAIAGTAFNMTYTLTIDANRSIEFRVPRTLLGRRGTQIPGPGGITVSYPFVGAFDPTQQCSFMVTYRNGVATY